jgi:hypothetical protein
VRTENKGINGICHYINADHRPAWLGLAYSLINDDSLADRRKTVGRFSSEHLELVCDNESSFSTRCFESSFHGREAEQLAKLAVSLFASARRPISNPLSIHRSR